AERASGAKEVLGCIERAKSLVEPFEASMPRPPEARDSARRALEALDRARDLGALEGPRGQGAHDAEKSPGPALRKRALKVLARALDATDALPGERAALEEAAKIPPPDAEVLLRLGQLRHVQGDLAGAVSAFSEAVSLNTKEAVPHIEKASA